MKIQVQNEKVQKINPITVYSSFREEFINKGILFEKVKLACGTNKTLSITRAIWVSCSAYAEASADTVVTVFAFAPAPMTAL
jgi:hypothetical protein